MEDQREALGAGLADDRRLVVQPVGHPGHHRQLEFADAVAEQRRCLGAGDHGGLVAEVLHLARQRQRIDAIVGEAIGQRGVPVDGAAEPQPGIAAGGHRRHDRPLADQTPGGHADRRGLAAEPMLLVELRIALQDRPRRQRIGDRLVGSGWRDDSPCGGPDPHRRRAQREQQGSDEQPTLEHPPVPFPMYALRRAGRKARPAPPLTRWPAREDTAGEPAIRNYTQPTRRYFCSWCSLAAIAMLTPSARRCAGLPHGACHCAGPAESYERREGNR